MKVLELCLSPAYGGLELHFRDLTRWLSAREDVDLFVCVRAGTALERDLIDLQAETLRFGGRASALPFRSSRRLARFIDRHAIDVVHIHWKFDLALCAFARRQCRHPFRFVHSRHMELPAGKHDPYHRFLYGAVDLYLAATRRLARQARERLPLSPGQIEVIYPGGAVGIDPGPDALAALAREIGATGAFTAGVIGRISRYKGQHLLVRAVGELRQQGLDVTGIVVGSAEPESHLDELRALAAELGVADAVHFHGFRSDADRIVRCFDVFCLTTKKETFGLALVEAMLAGVPAIGTEAGGVPEIIDDHETGLLFEPGNAQALAAAIRRLHDDPELRARLATAGRAKAERMFQRDRQLAAVHDRLRRLVETGREG